MAKNSCLGKIKLLNLPERREIHPETVTTKTGVTHDQKVARPSIERHSKNKKDSEQWRSFGSDNRNNFLWYRSMVSLSEFGTSTWSFYFWTDVPKKIVRTYNFSDWWSDYYRWRYRKLWTFTSLITTNNKHIWNDGTVVIVDYLGARGLGFDS